MVAGDGVWMSFTQNDRRLYRTLFNITEPAVSIWCAAHVFHIAARWEPVLFPSGGPSMLLATIAMAAVFFGLNSGLTAIAVALETHVSPFDVWRRHAWYLAMNYYAAASLATLAVGQGSINAAVVGLVAPLLMLSYVAYTEASGRVDEAQRHVGEVERLYQASVEMLAIAVDTKDQVTHGHIRRVQRHTIAVARALGVTAPHQLKAIEAGALLHDIGKLGVPDYLLNKPTTLTRAEFDVMKKHTTTGARILAAVNFPYPVVPIVRHHHERWDGKGYPDGLVAAEIPVGARILAVVDCFDALTSDRPYRPRLSDEEAVGILRERQGTFYDPAVVERFVALIPDLRRQDEELGRCTEGRQAFVAGLRQIESFAFHGDLASMAYFVPRVPRQVKQLIDEQASQLAAEACLMAMTAAGDVLCVAYATRELTDRILSLQMPVGAGISGWVAANRSTIPNANPSLDAEIFKEAGFCCCTSTPVFSEGELFGVLTMYGTRPSGFNRDAVAAIGSLGQEIGLAIGRGDHDAVDVGRVGAPLVAVS
jgi:putative nucleotidyltransferase with HDIG domain